jgi:hypothetical protein
VVRLDALKDFSHYPGVDGKAIERVLDGFTDVVASAACFSTAFRSAFLLRLQLHDAGDTPPRKDEPVKPDS